MRPWIGPLLPVWPDRAPGPWPAPDRLCLQGILFVLYNDIARRLERRQRAEVFDRLHRILLAELNAAGELDWSRACVDGSHVRAKNFPCGFRQATPR
jgi:hypothetical protein